MIFRALVLRHLRANGLRAGVTLAAVALGVAIGLAIDLANTTAVSSFAAGVDLVANRVNLQVLGVGRGFDERTLLRVRRIPGVQSAAPVIEDAIVVGGRPDKPFSGEILRVLGVDLLQPLPRVDRETAPAPTAYAAATAAVDPFVAVAGRGAIVSHRVAETYHLRPGSLLHAVWGDRSIALRVMASLPANVTQVDSSVVFVDIVTAQELFDRVGLLDRIDCQVAPSALDGVTAAVARALPPGARAVRPAVRTDEIRRMLRSFQLNLAALSYIALLVGMFLIYNTLAISVVERRPEIGTLRALGASRAAIFRAFLGEGVLFGVAGSALGLLLGAFLASVSVGAVTRTVDTIYIAAHADGVAYDPLAFAKAFAIGVLVAAASALAPAIEAARTAPAVTMRGAAYERRGHGSTLCALAGIAMLAAAYAATLPPAIDGIPVFGYAAGLLVVFGAALCTPALIGASARAAQRLAAGRSVAGELGAVYLGAAPWRNGVAVASLMVAIAMTVSVAILVGSFRATVIAWAGDVLRADLFVRPVGPADAGYGARFSPGVVARIRAVPAVADVETFREVTLPFRGSLVTLGATDTGTLATHARLRLLGGASAAALARDLPGSRGAVISEPFASRFGARVGDQLRIGTPSGPATFTVAAIYNDYTSDAGTVIVDRLTFARLFGDDGVNQIAVYARRGADLVALRSAIVRSVAPRRIDVQTTRELRALVIAIFDRTFAITHALSIISIAIAVFGVVTTLFALVLERRREIALLRYVGLSVAGVRRMVYVEAAYIGLLGGASGVAVGFALALLLIFVINRQSFGWLIDLHVPAGFLVEAVALVVVAALAASIVPARIAANVGIAEAVRDE